MIYSRGFPKKIEKPCFDERSGVFLMTRYHILKIFFKKQQKNGQNVVRLQQDNNNIIDFCLNL